jgi:uncharacterized DUF497 family protein
MREPFPTTEGANRLEAEFNFINAQDFIDIKPYYYGGDLQPDQEHLRSNITYQKVPSIEVTDVRPCKSQFNLEVHGLQFYDATDPIRELPQSPDSIEAYLSNIATWVKSCLAAEKVIVYDYAVSSMAGKFLSPVSLRRSNRRRRRQPSK